MISPTEFRRQITERYTNWAEAWGVALAFAVTQSVEESEKLVADAIVALIARDPIELERQALSPRDELLNKKPTKPIARVSLPPSVTAVRFAGVLWELASERAFRGFGHDMFFRMPAVARAVVVLKTKAQFSRHQIAAATHLTIAQVDDHLENARLLYSEGKAWLQESPGVMVEKDNWSPECPRWSNSSTTLQDTFAQYVGNDLDADTSHALHNHMLVCENCRANFSYFKSRYVEWAGSVPMLETDKAFRKHIAQVTQMALKVNRANPPSPWPGLKRVMRDSQVHIMLTGAALIMLVQYALKHVLK